MNPEELKIQAKKKDSQEGNSRILNCLDSRSHVYVKATERKTHYPDSRMWSTKSRKKTPEQ